MEIVDKILWTVISGFIVFGLFSSMQASGISFEEIKNRTISEPGKTSISLFLCSQGLGMTTPALTKDWLPPKGKYTFILEDMPFLDAVDIIPVAIAIIVALIVVFYVPLFKFSENGLLGVLYSCLLFVFLILFAVIVWKIIWYFVMIASCGNLGIENVLEVRASLLSKTQDILKPLFLVSILTFIGAGKLLWNKFSGDEN